MENFPQPFAPLGNAVKREPSIRVVALVRHWFPLHTVSAYTLVGIVSTVAYLGVSSALTHWAGLHPGIASFLAYFVSATISYVGHRNVTFRSDAPHQRTLPSFIVVSLTGLALAAIIPKILVDNLGVPPDAAFVTVSIVVAAVTYGALKVAVFMKK